MFPGRLLSQFITVAEELHFGRAAARLHMAQPPLSQAIKHLEELVGVQLLVRSRHSVVLTPAGRAFLDDARELLMQGQRAIEAARRASEGRIGRITIGFVGSASYELLPRILHNFRMQFPAIHVDLRELISAEQIVSLHAGKIDLGIVRLPLSKAADINMRIIEVERFIAVLPRQHRLAATQSLRLEDLAEDSFHDFPARQEPGPPCQISLGMRGSRV